MSEVAELLKGPRGTHVQVVAQREGVDKPMTFNIIRDEIPAFQRAVRHVSEERHRLRHHHGLQ